MYEKALEMSSSPDALHNFVVSTIAPVIHLTTLSSFNDALKKAVDLHFKNSANANDIYNFDLLEPSSTCCFFFLDHVHEHQAILNGLKVTRTWFMTFFAFLV